METQRVCVGGPGKPYVMGTKCPVGNIQNPCGDIFLVPMRKQANK